MLQKHKPLSVALDCDDVLMPCVELALEIQQKKYGFEPPLTLEEVTNWSLENTRCSCITECFKDKNFFKKQRPYDGAQDFVRKLCEKADVYIMTAVPVCAMGIRAEMICKYFPDIQQDHIILTSSKDLVDVDVLLDDAPHNIQQSKAKYPVVMKRPWNNDFTGILSVNTYDEFLCLIDEIKTRYDDMIIDSTKPYIIGLVGISGSGKSLIAKKLVETGNFIQPQSYTDRPRRDENENYIFVDKNEFKSLKESGEIFESTVYSGHNYGSSERKIREAIANGKNVVIPVDMCGAMGLKTKFKNVVTVFVDRQEEKLLTTLLERNCPTSDKVKRIMSMDIEKRNAKICDYILDNYGDIDDVVNDLISKIEN